MIEYAKVLLPRVTQWPHLFKKELGKCLEWISNEERIEFRVWCYEKFYTIHPDILDEVFMKTYVFPRRLSKGLEMKFESHNIWRKTDNVKNSKN